MTKMEGKELNCIPNNKNKYISFSVGGEGGCVSLPAFISLQESLDSPVNNMPPESFKYPNQLA